MAVTLTGLDGSNPLAFFAALGALRALHEAGRPARLRWVDEGRWRPALDGPRDIDEVVAVVAAELPSWQCDPALDLSYEKGGRALRDLKPEPALFRAYLAALAERAAAGDRRPADTAAAFGSELVVDNSGFTKPTALHFTAGQQQFLAMVRDLAQGVSADHLRRALVGPWRSDAKLPSLSWDATVFRDYALRASDPSKDKRGSEPGAEWLAFLGLRFFPVAPVGARLHTTATSGGWKTGRLRWPLWSAPAGVPSVAALLSAWDPVDLDRRQREALGIPVAFECSIGRSEQGGYGSFSPAKVI